MHGTIQKRAPLNETDAGLAKGSGLGHKTPYFAVIVSPGDHLSNHYCN